ncbi:unnamed protein product [Fraxinus pennsylvanica]|uniref:Reticulon-like protein n=1 Tax=Fraxinus pennsylvanica TaxID=56036 RepID=A0AAD2AEP8_9LAMI|nr:unnamed protein product [Fraxinus pennsylvanica]
MPMQPSNSSGNVPFFGKSVHGVLGGGKMADTLLWKNYKVSGGVLGGATLTWFLLEVIGFHVLSIVCRVLLLALSVLFAWSCGAKLIKKTPPKIPEIAIKEVPALKLASALRIQINQASAILKLIASGKDLKKFLLVNGGLALVSTVGSWFNFLTLIYLATVFLFTVPLVYDKYGHQINSLAGPAMAEIKKYYGVIDAKVLSKIPIGESRN